MSRPRKHPLPSIDALRARLSYDPRTGLIATRCREGDDAYTVAFNRRYGGRTIGYPMNVGYLFLHLFGHCHLAHRVAWALHHGEWPEGELDHKNGNKTDNRLDNLRIASKSQNKVNSKLAGSIYKGISRTPNGQRWRAMLLRHGVNTYLGTYDTAEEAAEVYAQAARELHGEFAFTPAGSINTRVSITALAA